MYAQIRVESSNFPAVSHPSSLMAMKDEEGFPLLQAIMGWSPACWIIRVRIIPRVGCIMLIKRHFEKQNMQGIREWLVFSRSYDSSDETSSPYVSGAQECLSEQSVELSVQLWSMKLPWQSGLGM